MALYTGLAIGAASLAAGVKQGIDAKKAAKAQQKGFNAATDEQTRQFELQREDTQPYRDVGVSALSQLSKLYGLSVPGMNGMPGGGSEEPETSLVGDTVLPVQGRRIVPIGNGRYKVFYGETEVGDLTPGGQNGRFVGNGNPVPAIANTPAPEMDPAQAAAAGKPDYSAFMNSPDYEFARQEGQRGIERSAAARGGLASGNTLASLSRFNQGLATQNYGNYVNRLASLAGIGQSSTESLADRRGQLAVNVGNNAVGGAGARASGINNSAGAYSDTIGQLAGAYGYFARPGQQQQLSGQEINSIFRPHLDYSGGSTGINTRGLT